MSRALRTTAVALSAGVLLAAGLPGGAASAAPAATHGSATPGYVADYETYTVASSVAIRSCPHVTSSCGAYALINPKGAAVDLKCWVHGDRVPNGKGGYDNIWYYGYWMGSGYPEGYMAGENLATGYDPNSNVAPC